MAHIEVMEREKLCPEATTKRKQDHVYGKLHPEAIARMAVQRMKRAMQNEMKNCEGKSKCMKYMRLMLFKSTKS